MTLIDRLNDERTAFCVGLIIVAIAVPCYAAYGFVRARHWLVERRKKGKNVVSE